MHSAGEHHAHTGIRSPASAARHLIGPDAAAERSAAHVGRRPSGNPPRDSTDRQCRDGSGSKRQTHPPDGLHPPCERQERTGEPQRCPRAPGPAPRRGVPAATHRCPRDPGSHHPTRVQPGASGTDRPRSTAGDKAPFRPLMAHERRAGVDDHGGRPDPRRPGLVAGAGCHHERDTDDRGREGQAERSCRAAHHPRCVPRGEPPGAGDAAGGTSSGPKCRAYRARNSSQEKRCPWPPTCSSA